MLSDPIADMLTRIRNASMIEHRQVVMPSSKIKAAIAKILYHEGFVERFVVTDDKPQPKLIIDLKYTGKGDSVITGLERVSKPGRRLYIRGKELKPILGGLGIQIISSSKGVISDREARRENIGGEVLCELW